MTTLRERVQQVAPPWLRRWWGSRLLYAFGLMSDGAWQWALEALRARLPMKAHPTALGPIGRDRRIIRGYQESPAAYASRLVGAIDDWRIAGNPIPLLRQLQGYFSPQKPRIRTVSNRGTWYTIEPDGSILIHKGRGNWDWDGSDLDATWWRFWVIVYPNSTDPPIFDDEDEWGDDPDGEWGDNGETWGAGTPAERIETLRQIIVQWKPQRMRCERAGGIIAAYDNDSFDPESAPGAPGMPDGTWGVGVFDDAGVTRSSRLGTAAFFDGPDPEA